MTNEELIAHETINDENIDAKINDDSSLEEQDCFEEVCNMLSEQHLTAIIEKVKAQTEEINARAGLYSHLHYLLSKLEPVIDIVAKEATEQLAKGK